MMWREFLIREIMLCSNIIYTNLLICRTCMIPLAAVPPQIYLVLVGKYSTILDSTIFNSIMAITLGGYRAGYLTVHE